MTKRTIVLASTSPYRRQLLARLQLPFEVCAPDIDEAPLAGEKPQQTASRLAAAKAARVAQRFPLAIVIGSDQVADLEGEALSKPGSHAAAMQQLQKMQGRTVVFHTAVTVIADEQRQSTSVPTTVTFRQLSDTQLEAYLQADRPYDCAGAAKIEALGVALVERVTSDDPTALIGLPLIAVVSMFARCGIDLPVPR